MYQYMFVENKKKKEELLKQIEEGEIKEAVTSTRSDVKYLSTLNTRRNPDILMPGGKFLKGNHYFKGDEGLKPSESGFEKSSDKATDSEGDDAFNKIM
jgi:hypothetical protein